MGPLQTPCNLGEGDTDHASRTNDFFKHKYITQSELTTADALTIASDNLIQSLQNAPPKSKAMQTAVNALVKVFKSQAKASESATDQARKRRNAAQSQRVRTEAETGQAQRMVAEEQGPLRTWTRYDAGASAT